MGACCGILLPMNADIRVLSERIAEAARDLQDHQTDLEATFQLAAELATSNVEGCHGAGLSIARQRKTIETVATTSPMVVDADRLQYELGEGPCLDSIWEEEALYSPDLRHDHRWPTWGPRVVEETDARSVLSFRVFTHAETLGALTLYSRAVDAFDDAAREEGLAIAAQVAIAVAAAREIGHLSLGLDTRTVIGQATGILMERFDLDGDVAFKVLARYSSTSNVKLREVAAEILRTRTLPDGAHGP